MKQASSFSRLALMALTPCVLLGFSLSEAPRAHAADQGRKIEVIAKRFEFSPKEITVKAGEPILLVLHSEDVTHGLKQMELNLQAEVPKGGAAEVSFVAAKPGDYVAHCAHFCGEGHGQMTFIIHVTE